MRSLMILSFVVAVLMVSSAEAGRRNRRCNTYQTSSYQYSASVYQTQTYGAVRYRGQSGYYANRSEREFQPFRRPIRTFMNIHPLGRIIQGKHPLFFVR